MKVLNRTYLSILTAFHEAGGAGDLDNHCRVTAGQQRHPMPGDSSAWLVLVSHGLVAGEDGRIIMTEAGRAKADEIIAGRVREAV